MKHTLTIFAFCIAFCYAAKTNAQYRLAPTPPNYPIVNQPGATLMQIVDTMVAHANPADTSEGGERDQISQFFSFWMNRVAANDSSGSNMFQQYDSAMNLAGAARLTSTSCSSGAFSGDWASIGADNLLVQAVGYVSVVWGNPNDSNIILAATQGGLFKTTNAGANWHCISDNSPLAGGTMYLPCMAVNPLDSNTIFCGSNGGGLIKSFDGGNTWSQEFIVKNGEVVNYICFTPDSVRLYAIVDTFNTYYQINVSAVYTRLSTNGSPWMNISPTDIDPYTSWYSMQFVPGNRDHIFITSEGDSTGIWETTDSLAATGWTKITAGFSDTIGGVYTSPSGWKEMNISAPGNDTLYFIAMDSITSAYWLGHYALAALYKYNISGSAHSITKIYDNLPYQINPSTTKFQLIVSPSNPNNIYYGSDIPSQAYDRTHGFIPIGTYYAAPTHADIRGLWLQHDSSAANGLGDRVLLATDGGVSLKPSGVNVATAGASTTKDITGIGLDCGTYWSFAIGEASAGAGGMMHDGIVTYEPSQSQQWECMGTSDAFNCEIDKSQPTKAYAYDTYESLEVTSSAGGRQMGTVTGFPSPSDPVLEGWETQIPIVTDNFHNIYTSISDFWRKRPSDPGFYDMSGTLPGEWGFPKLADGDTQFAMAMAINPNDTIFEGYVLYYDQSSLRHIFYRNPSILGFANATEIPNVPGNAPYVFPVSGITTDPNNTNRVWVSQGGNNWNTLAYSVYRAQFSPDHGNTWIDISNGLPQFAPTDNIIYDDVTNVLYASTDVGMYMCDFNQYIPGDTTRLSASRILINTSVQWTCFNQGAVSGQNFPNIGANEMRISHCSGKLYAATWGRSVWATDLDLPWNIVVSGDTITTPTNWTTNHYVTGAIVVDSGVALNFTDDTVFMPRNAAIIVRPGGRLILNHAVVTNECDACMWYGIEAYGNNRLPQNPTNQAWVQIDSGSVVANARYAVSNGDIWDDSAFGGIIQGYQSSFVDNHVDASFYPYFNTTSPGVVAPDLSYFENCTFSTDNNYKPDALYPFAHHVYMYGVQGIFFTGCQFSNRNDLGSTRGFGEGIMATDAGFSTGVYCPEPYYSLSGCPTPVRTRFSGFATGIDIGDVGGAALTISIDQTDFDTISTGISVATENNVSVTRCNFKVGNGNGVLDVSSMDSTGCEQNIGVLIQNADQFRMEQNTFTGIPIGGGWYNFGAVVANSDANGTQSNMVYRNTFDSLTEGVYAIGCNATGSSTPGSVLATGLEILCNAFSNNTNDIYVANDGNTREG